MTNGTQLTKSLSIGHVITTIGLVIAGFTFVYDLREAIAILQFKGETTEQRLERVIQRNDGAFEEIKEQLNRLEVKIDELVLGGQFQIQQKGQ